MFFLFYLCEKSRLEKFSGLHVDAQTSHQIVLRWKLIDMKIENWLKPKKKAAAKKQQSFRLSDGFVGFFLFCFTVLPFHSSFLTLSSFSVRWWISSKWITTWEMCEIENSLHTILLSAAKKEDIRELWTRELVFYWEKLRGWISWTFSIFSQRVYHMHETREEPLRLQWITSIISS